MTPRTRSRVKALDAKLSTTENVTGKQEEKYALYLYIAGATPRSMRAVANLKKICADHLAGNYTLEVVDLYQQPQLAEGEQIIAAPTLIKKMPLPVRRIVGDLSDTARVLTALDLEI